MSKFKVSDKKSAEKKSGDNILDKRNVKYISSEVGKGSVCQDSGRRLAKLRHNEQERTGVSMV